MRCFFIAFTMFALTISSALAAQPVPPVPPPPPVYTGVLIARAPFNPAEFKKYEETGKSSVIGGTWVSNTRGFKRIMPNTTVYMIPRTAFTDDMYLLGRFVSSNGIAEPQLQKYIKKTTTDADGKFEFRDLPAGAYTLEIVVKANPNSQQNFNSVTDKVVLLRIELAENEAKTVRLGN